MNVLLIEPDRILGQTICTTLEGLGHKVVWKRSAQTALDALDDVVPDAIVLELQLGVHNGVEFLYEIASYPEWQGIPVIVHTINTKAREDTFAEAFHQLNVQTVLYKPQTTTPQLLRAITQFAPAV